MAAAEPPSCPLCGKGMEALIAAWRCSCGAVMRRLPTTKRDARVPVAPVGPKP